MAEPNTIAANTFFNGLVMDNHPFYQQEGTYPYMLNGRKLLEDNINFGISNCLSTAIHTAGLGEVVGITLIEERDQWIVFSKSAKVSLVHTETGEVTEVIDLSSCGVNFNSCENIYAEMKTMEPCSELFIYFSSNCVYYVLNIDALLDPKRRGDYICDDYKLFKCVCVPSIEAEVSSAAGGNLPAGAYSFVAQLEDTDGNTTNWFNVSYPISIDSENNIGGEISRHSINITIDNLDKRYRKINLAVLKNIAGVETIETFPSFYYSGSKFTFEYYGQEGTGITLEEILTKKRTYIKGKDLIQKDNELLLYNILQRRNLDYQRRANEIGVKGVIYVARAEDAHKYRTLIRGERYLTSIGFNHCSGEKTHSFVLSNYGGGFSAPDVGEEPVVPRVDENPAGSHDTHTTTLEESRNSDPVKPDNPGDTTTDAFDDISSGLEDIPDDLYADDCVDCGKTQTDAAKDLTNIFSITNIDLMTNTINEGRIHKKNKIKSSGLKGAIKNLLDTIKDVEDDPEENKEVYEVNNFTPTQRDKFDFSNYGKLSRYKDLAKIGEFNFNTFESTDVYPTTKDCMGEYIYGDLQGTPIKLLEVPDENHIPFFVSFQNGVKSQKTLGVDEFQDAFVFFIGIKLDNIEFPIDDELHTPLCEETPYTIYMAESSSVNRHIVAKGIMPHTFQGKINGKDHMFPKHAVNSFEHVDRHIQNGDDQNRMGSPHTLPIFTFQSPDTSVGKPFLNVDRVSVPGQLEGQGFMHGQYAYGEEPKNAFFGREKDQKGVRQSINLNHFTGHPFETDLSGITFAKGNRVTSNANGIDFPLCNMYRESCVYLQLDTLPPLLRQGVQNGYADYSFIGQGLNHSCSIPYAAAHYAVLKNDIPDQYGSVESLIYNDTGLSAIGRETSIEGLVGDGFIGPWTIKKTSYVSNKVGDEAILPSRRRVGSLLQYFGFGDCTRPPDSGDTDDVKNRANLHPNQGCGIRPAAPATDIFFPRTLSSMVVYWVESRVNVWLRATGLAEGQVYYPKLKDLELDSNVPNGTAWENAWLNRFYCLINRSSKALIIARAAIRLGVFFGGLAFIIVNCLQINSLPDVFMFIVRLILMILLWVVAFFFIFTNRNLNKLFGLDECLDDRQGAQDHEQIRGWEDNYFDYNFDYSLPNRYNFAVGVPDPYNVCDCDDCELNQVTHEIFLSNPQIVGSPIDSYKNFQANSMLNFPLDTGKITKLINFQDRLLAHTTDSFKILSYKASSLNLDDQNIFLGGGYIERPETIGGDQPTGSFGLQHPNHSFVFPGGYVWIDQKSNKIWLMQGLGNIQDITLAGNKAFFRNKIGLCETGNCIGEGVKDELGYTFGYDPLEDLLYVTKKDGDNSEGCVTSFTISYDMQHKHWFSFHSFVPQVYLATRKNFYSLKDQDIWIHNKDKCNHQMIYGDFVPHIVEFVTKNNILNVQELDSFQFYTQANRCEECSEVNLYNQFDTFNKALFYNTTQASGELLLQMESDYLGNRDNLIDSIKDKGNIVPLVWQGENWQVNRIRDFVNNPELPLWLCGCDCTIEKTFNEDNLNFNKRPENSNIIFDKYMKVRLTYDKPSAVNTQLITHYTLVNNKNEIS